MKKIVLILMAALMLFAGCSPKQEPNTIIDGKKLDDVLAHVDTKFEEKYGNPALAVLADAINEQVLLDFYSLEAADIADMAGSYSLTMINSDTLVAVQAAEGKADKVVAAFIQRKADLEAQFENYNVSGSYDRALAGEVYQKGDYVFLIVVGQPSGEGMDITYDFAGDVAMTKAAIDEMFYA